MRSFRPPRSTGLAFPKSPSPAPVSAARTSPPPEPEPQVEEVPLPSMDCTPLLTGLLRGRTPQEGCVAIICEDEMLCGRLRRDLEQDGHHVLAAASGPALIPLLVGCTPRLLLVHEQVADPQPFELCGTLRDDEALEGIELVLMTSKVSVDARRVAFHAGANDLLTLPYLRSELRGRVGLRLELHSLRNAEICEDAGERAAG